MYKSWNEIKKRISNKSCVVEVFIIENKKDLCIIQLPNLFISNKILLFIQLNKTNKAYTDFNINKELIIKHFYSRGSKLIVLKEEHIYWYIDLYFVDLLEIINRVNRINNMKAFW